jgi:hypothetical protein
MEWNVRWTLGLRNGILAWKVGLSNCKLLQPPEPNVSFSRRRMTADPMNRARRNVIGKRSFSVKAIFNGCLGNFDAIILYPEVLALENSHTQSSPCSSLFVRKGADLPRLVRPSRWHDFKKYVFFGCAFPPPPLHMRLVTTLRALQMEVFTS